MRKIVGSCLAMNVVLGGAALADGSNPNANNPLPVQGASSSAPLPTIANVECAGAACLTTGGFTPTFVEPVIYDRVGQTAGLPIQNPLKQEPVDGRCTYDTNGNPIECKPAGASLANLPDGRILYFNNLEGTENVEFSILIEGGGTIINDQTRVLTENVPGKLATWTLPGPIDGGAGQPATCLLPGCLLNTGASGARDDAGALFCADLKNLYDGRVIAVGGTDYYAEPGVSLTVDQSPFTLGVIELEGLKSSRIYDESQNGWAQTGDMNYGRWYPALTTLPDGDLMVVGGVTKLAKPVYPNDPLTSGQNVAQTETFHLGTGTWTDNGATAQRSLPLFPRMHLLPNGQVFYDAGGQAFSPFGQSIDQPLWNIVGAYDPATATWTDLGYAGLPLQLNSVGAGQIVSAIRPDNPLAALTLTTVVNSLVGQTLTDPAGQIGQALSLVGLGGGSLTSQIDTAIGSGMRGSTFSLMMPLTPNAAGGYEKASFLVSGGVLTAVAATNPGTYLAVTLSRLDTVDLSTGTMEYSSQLTGPLNQPRWYGTPALLPTGQVMVFSGSDRDEVVTPGVGVPVMTTEMYDPDTQTWTEMAKQNDPRTYHNTALLQQDGTVLVGGHAPINTLYLYSINIPGFSPNFSRDPSFEVYYPPYMFRARPTITSAPTSVAPGQTFTISTPQASTIASVALVRRTALTHDVDGDQRTVMLPIVARGSGTVTVSLTSNQAVVPPGNYMLFVNQAGATTHAKDLTPSPSAPVLVTGANLDG